MDRLRRTLSSRAFLPSVAITAALYYALIIGGRRLTLWAPAISPGESQFQSTLGYVFNDMLLRLLHGDFTIDPAIIKWEAVFEGHKIYTYFGVMPALLRIFLLPFFDLTKTDVSPLCLWIAATLTVVFKAGALRAAARTSTLISGALLALLLFAGAPLQFLRVTVYQEAIMWEAVCASAFLAVAIAAIADLENGFTKRRLICMALAAGLCLLTRVVLATGLFAALLGILFFATKRNRAIPLAVLAFFVAIAGFINTQRFGNPLVFHRPSHTVLVYPNGTPPALRDYGEFTPGRIPYGLMYYFAPVWFIHAGPDGEFLLHDFKARVMDLVEPPPGSFLITDTLLLLLAITGATTLRRNRPAALIAAGLAIPPLLMLTAYAMTFRYRMEFYPLLEFLALISIQAPPRWTSNAKLVVPLALLGILASHVMLIAYKISPGGSLERGQSLGTIYRERLTHRQ